MQHNTNKLHNRPKVCVFLSSYNGHKYIETQIDSILNQIDVNIELVIRDDGSTDDTVQLIKKHHGKILLKTGKNIGCEQSFAELLKYKSDADFYAFADQDDYWLPNKVISEIRAIEKIDGPALASCNLFLCNEHLEILATLHSPEAIASIRKVMHDSYLCNMHGCVLLWNRALQEQLCKNVPNNIISHDGWVNSVANAIGTTIVLDEPLIRYRIHKNNVAGHASSLIERFKKGLRIYLGKNHPKRDIIANNMLAIFGKEMDKNSNGYDTLIKISNYKKSIRARFQLINKDIIKKSPIPDRWFWILCVMIGKY